MDLVRQPVLKRKQAICLFFNSCDLLWACCNSINLVVKVIVFAVLVDGFPIISFVFFFYLNKVVNIFVVNSVTVFTKCRAFEFWFWARSCPAAYPAVQLQWGNVCNKDLNAEFWYNWTGWKRLSDLRTNSILQEGNIAKYSL